MLCECFIAFELEFCGSLGVRNGRHTGVCLGKLEMRELVLSQQVIRREVLISTCYSHPNASVVEESRVTVLEYTFGDFLNLSEKVGEGREINVLSG